MHVFARRLSGFYPNDDCIQSARTVRIDFGRTDTRQKGILGFGVAVELSSPTSQHPRSLGADLRSRHGAES